jgi:hypothetical protein
LIVDCVGEPRVFLEILDRRWPLYRRATSTSVVVSGLTTVRSVAVPVNQEAEESSVPNHYDVTIITVPPNKHPKALPVLKDNLANSPGLLACWYSDIGALNQIMIIRSIGDVAANLKERSALLASRNPFGIGDLIVGMQMDTYTAFEHMPPMVPAELGPFYEVRTYVLKPDGVATTNELWRKWVPGRAKISPVLTAMVSSTGTVARFIHIWPYKSLDERAKLRAKSVSEGVWPPPGGPDQLARMQNDIYLPAPFSPLR